jgi:hypothetical protein
LSHVKVITFKAADAVASKDPVLVVPVPPVFPKALTETLSKNLT